MPPQSLVWQYKLMSSTAKLSTAKLSAFQDIYSYLVFLSYDSTVI